MTKIAFIGAGSTLLSGFGQTALAGSGGQMGAMQALLGGSR